VVTVGTFDGLHLGHRKLIERLIASGSPSTVVTFYPHPQLVVARPGKEIKILTLPEEKVAGLEKMGVEQLLVIPFDRDIMNLTAEEFLTKVILEKIGLRKLVVGYDHAFGKDRKGNKDFLIEKGKVMGFEVEVVEPYYYDGNIISSTLIRKVLEAGDVKKASEYLGWRYSFSGWVIRGDARGAILGFPTANLKLASPVKLLPYCGVYAIYTHIGTKKYPALLYIGHRPTYGFGDLSIEVFLMNFTDNLYGEKIIVELVDGLRGDIAFRSEKELVEQMQRDRIQAEAILL
jgi:riboflavin kinase/FMN adenylyltransferase